MLSGFENGFEKEEKEIVVLLKDCCNGARFFEKNWLIPSVNFIASVDEATGEMIKEEGRIEENFLDLSTTNSMFNLF